MKKIVSLFLSLVFLLSSMTVLVFAEDTAVEGGEEELTNVAGVENAIAYASSEKNTLWTPAKALNDGAKGSDTWQGWECKYPSIIYGQDTSDGFSGEYCGIKFTNKEYYEIYEINLNTGMHSAMGGQNAHYTVQCLVEGVWITVAEFSDSDTTPLSNFTSYEDAMANDTSYYHIPAEISFKLDNPVTTNNVRITVSDFAKNYPGGDVLIFPYIYEIELIGKRGITPDLELPEGAVISTNIGYHSFPEASSSANYRYPYCAIDGDVKSSWGPKSKDAGEYLSLVFEEAKKMNKAVVNFGTYAEGVAVEDYKFDIEVLVDGEWVNVAQGTSFDEENATLITEYSFEAVETTAIRLVFTEASKKAPRVYEFEAHLSDSKTYYVENRYTALQENSASKGNIAIVGTPYASLDFFPYSDVNYIIDGKTHKDAYVWFTGVIDMPSYCGVKFNEKQVIDRVALYFETPSVEGTDIMGIQIQALIDGEYVTLVTTKSYDENMKYAPAYKFDPVETDDIRILYTSGNGTFAHLKELEIYSPNGSYPMFDGLPALENPPSFIDLTTKNEEESGTEVENLSSSNVSLPEDNKVLNENAQTVINPEVEENNSLLTVSIVVGAFLTLAIVGLIAFAYVKRKKLK